MLHFAGEATNFLHSFCSIKINLLIQLRYYFNKKTGQSGPQFIYYCVFCAIDRLAHFKKLPKVIFEPRYLVLKSDFSANCVTTTASFNMISSTLNWTSFKCFQSIHSAPWLLQPVEKSVYESTKWGDSNLDQQHLDSKARSPYKDTGNGVLLSLLAFQ